MADLTVIQFPPGEPPKERNRERDGLLAEEIKQIASHLNECATMLFEGQDDAQKAGIQYLVVGVETLVMHYADELKIIAGYLDPQSKEEGGTQ